MAAPMDEQAFVRYLAAKQLIDDRSLSHLVWEAMIDRLRAVRPRVVELGGGIGTMVERAAADGRLRPASWTLLDAQPRLVAEARRRLGSRETFPVSFVVEDIETFCAGSRRRYDLVIAHAVLDLLDLPRILGAIHGLAAGGGRFLFTLNFDGLTAWEPEVDAELDARIVSLYHRTMDERLTDGKPSGDSRSGRHLLTLLPRLGYRIEEAGASDWIVFPREGRYSRAERTLLESVLAFVEESLSGRSEISGGELGRWLRKRRAQLAEGTLVFLAHQLDVLAAAMDGEPRRVPDAREARRRIRPSPWRGERRSGSRPAPPFRPG